MKSTSAAVLLFVLFLSPQPHATAELRAGAAVVDVTPIQFPVLLNGGMLSRSEDRVKTPVNARAIVLDDGRERIGIVVVDSCMMPRPLLDEAKQLAAARTEIQPDRMLISATHTHTAPSCLPGLPWHRRRSNLRSLLARKTGSGSSRGRGKPRTGTCRLGGQECCVVRRVAALDTQA